MFSRFDTIPECDSQPPSQPPSHVPVAITLNAKASSLKTNKIAKSSSTIQRTKTGNTDVWQLKKVRSLERIQSAT